MRLREERLYLGYRLLGMPLKEKMHEYLHTQYFSKQEMMAYQSEKLIRLIQHAFNHVPYYRELFITHGIVPADIKDIRDIGKIPVLSKQHIRSAFPENIVADNVPESERLFKRTSGSTGTPLEFYNHKRAISVSNALLYRALSWTGHKIGDPFLFLWGVGRQRASLGERLRRSFSDKIVMDTNLLDDNQLRAIFQVLVNKKIKLVYGYPSALAIFSQYLAKQKIDISSEIVAVTTAEVLTDVHREMISAALSKSIFDLYGCNEINMIAFSDRDAMVYKISAEHVFIEIVDSQFNKLTDGAMGNIVCTDFDNYAMPFIRYNFGDCGSLKDSSQSLPLMSKIEGRAVDFIKGADGGLHSGVIVQKLLRGGLPGIENYKALGIEQFQMTQQQDGSLDVLLVTVQEFNEEALRELKDELHSMVGDLAIRVHRVKDIAPEKSGKRRTIISKVLANKYSL